MGILVSSIWLISIVGDFTLAETHIVFCDAQIPSGVVRKNQVDIYCTELPQLESSLVDSGDPKQSDISQ